VPNTNAEELVDGTDGVDDELVKENWVPLLAPNRFCPLGAEPAFTPKSDDFGAEVSAVLFMALKENVGFGSFIASLTGFTSVF